MKEELREEIKVWIIGIKQEAYDKGWSIGFLTASVLAMTVLILIQLLF